MPGQNDLWPWLQSILGNQGAANPLDPNAIPAAAPQGMPGAIVNGMPAMTRGGPSMGYQALSALPPGAANSLPLATGNVTSQDYNNWLQAQTQPQAPQPDQSQPDAPNFVRPEGQITRTFPMWPTPPAPQGTPSETPKPADSASKGPLASPGDSAAPMKRRAGAPNLGYYQGNPRFSTFRYETPNSSKDRAPIYTAMNLGGPTPFGPFGGGQQPAAVNPNVPAANAQPVASPVYQQPSIHMIDPATADANAPWWMGPQQRGRRWNPNSNDYSP